MALVYGCESKHFDAKANYDVYHSQVGRGSEFKGPKKDNRGICRDCGKLVIYKAPKPTRVA